MTINVLDTHTAMTRVLSAPTADRAAELRTMLEPIAGMYRYAPGDVDLVAVHHQTFGFPIDRDEDRCLEALDQLAQAKAWDRTQHAMDHALAVLSEANPALDAPDITVLLALGDPANTHFMDTVRGLVGFGGISGYIYITLWPHEVNLDRIEPNAVHELHHNLRYSPGGVVWDPSVVTVGEQVVGEGLADAFARQLYGDALGYTPIGVPHLEDDAVLARVIEGLGVTGMENFTAWVHGDASAERLGVTPVGVPTGAGYAVGNRLVDAYLKQTGQSAAEALHADSATVIATALEVLR
ncbi:peptidase [Spiractinospora alimapuensis]|uniref:DUF2268 domain-containing protein n=1 Tax=Spiractinospora alimapuensis TaxID=2820884 RepID=UPI001F475351|nr:DUF2268 domain-containing putative Zn-dependent protease [Spiractinospora alimapuensis]QVQ52815.1 peptidase [Spiractinospora alimapuensis]